jgi:DNA-directed RNA polymerase specialized sigma24 family protein
MDTDSQAAATAAGKRVLTQDEFDRLLAWLDPDRERAGKRYEEIRRKLIKFFACRGCPEGEDLTDETINRVARNVIEIAENWSGDHILYFYKVAHYVQLEYRRKKPPPALPPPARPSDEVEREHACLEQCMQHLNVSSRKLVLEYYQKQKRAKIAHRERLAQQLGITLNALRIRACRIRENLYLCVQGCLAQQTAD